LVIAAHCRDLGIVLAAGGATASDEATGPVPSVGGLQREQAPYFAEASPSGIGIELFASELHPAR
jgi:hypothetical protein